MIINRERKLGGKSNHNRKYDEGISSYGKENKLKDSFYIPQDPSIILDLKNIAPRVMKYYELNHSANIAKIAKYFQISKEEVQKEIDYISQYLKE
jgi:hypothetical protein